MHNKHNKNQTATEGLTGEARVQSSGTGQEHYFLEQS